MRFSLHRSLPLAASFFATAVLTHAHPGHEGDELTWDVSAGHLASHPLATLANALIPVAGAWGAARLVSVGSDYLAAVVRRLGSGRRD
jgi:hypothetical protein